MSTNEKVMLLCLVGLVMFSSPTTLTEAQNVPSCAQKLIPCQEYINNSTTTPPSSCCDPLSEAVTNELTCLCNLYRTPGLLESLNINVTLAANLTQRCGISGDLSACFSAQSPTAVPPPPPPPGNDGSRMAWTGLTNLLLLFASSFMLN